jgi:hypothetical protein
MRCYLLFEYGSASVRCSCLNVMHDRERHGLEVSLEYKKVRYNVQIKHYMRPYSTTVGAVPRNVTIGSNT